MVLTIGMVFTGAGVAGAQVQGCPESPQECGGNPVNPPTVGGNPVTPPSSGNPGNRPTPRTPTASVGGNEVEQSGLPVTGTDTAVLLGAGAAFVAGGGALVMRSKRVREA